MALQIRPNCELCDKDLPVHSTEAMICTYECTFCENCVTQLRNVCPNCGGGFVHRPIRPAKAWRDGVSRDFQKTSESRVHSKYDLETLDEFIARIKDIPPEKR